MSDPRTDLPAPGAPNFNQRLREVIQTYLGRQGNPLDRGLTIRDLVDTGVLKLRSGFQLKPGAGSSIPLEPGDGVVDTYEPDLTPPPTPGSMTVTASISHVMIEHEAPLYRQGHGHLRTRVYGKVVNAGEQLPTFADAAEIGQFSGTIYAQPSNPATTWRLWIKWETVDGVLSVDPAGGINGLEAVTGQDVALLLEALSGQITASNLHADLGARINLIDGPATLSGSVSQRIATEQITRASEIQAERQARAAALLTEAQARGTAISSETQSRITADSALQSQINMLSAAGSGDFSELLAAIQEEQTARIDGDTAEATQRTTLAAQVTELVAVDEYDALERDILGHGVNVLNTAERIRATASLTEEQTVRATADEALSQRITTLSATVGQNAATLTAEQTARATADEALSSNLLSLTAKVNTNTASITSEQQARATADSALTTSINYLQAQVNGNAASITSEAAARAGADSSLSTRIDTLTATVNTADANLSAAIQGEATARANADSAEAAARETLVARVTNAEGSIASQAVQISNRYTKTETDSAISSSSQALSASYQAADAATLSSANAAAEAYAAAKAELARVSSNAYADGVVTAEEQRAIADASAKAEAARVAAVNAAAADATAKANAAKAHADAGILSEQTTRANADSALASSITTLGATVNSNNTTLSAAIQQEVTARANADASQASQISTLQSTVATRGGGAALNADPNFSSNLAWEVYSGSAPQFVILADGAVGKTAIRSSAAGVQNWVNEKARIPIDPAKAYRAQGKLRTVSGSGSTAYLGVALFDADGNNISGNGSQWYYFASAVSPGAGWAAYSGEFGAGTSNPFPSNARTMAPLAILSYGGGSSIHEAQDLRIEDLTDVKLLTASIQTEATTRATQTGELYAKYGVKLDVNGYVTGWAMNNNGSTGDMIVLADRFAVGAPGGGNIVPFTVNTTPQTINGVYVPAGTYMDAAYIQNGTITNAKIANLAVDSAKIASVSADKVTAGSIAVGQHIQSAGYVAGSAGWRINGDGNAEFSNATVRGTVYATNGQFYGTLLGGAATGYSSGAGFYAGSPAAGAYQWRVGDPAGSRIEWDGANFNLVSPQLTIANGNASFGGSLNAASGTFSGALSGATGTFSGTLAAGVLDSAAFDSIKLPYSQPGNFPNQVVPEMKAGWSAMHLRITVVGAGGGGGGGAAAGAPNRNPTSSGGGGGAGQKNVYVVTSGVTPGAPFSVNVGSGGSSGSGSNYWNGSSVSGNPGGAGTYSGVTINGQLYSASGGAAGGAGTSALADAWVYSQPDPLYQIGQGGGAGGSIGGQNGTGGFMVSAPGGAGGSSEFGSGGAGGTASYDYAGQGSNGGIGSGGGGGGADASHPDRGYAANGGYGGPGYVMVEFYDPNTVVLNSRYSALVQWLDTVGHGAVPTAAR